MLDVHSHYRPDSLREREELRLAERRRRVPTPIPLPDHRWVQALLDRGPDREAGGEVMALHLKVRTVPHAHLVDLGEQVVGGIACEDVGESRLDAASDERQQAT